MAEGAPHYCVLADAGYGVDTAFRQALSDMGLLYAVVVTSAVMAWPPGIEPLPPKPYSGTGRPPVMPRRTARRQPMSVKALALSLPAQAFHTISWREGTNEMLSGRFAALRVRHAGGNAGKARLRPLEWLLIEWPAHEQEPSKYGKYVLSTLPEDTPINERRRPALQVDRLRAIARLPSGGRILSHPINKKQKRPMKATLVAVLLGLAPLVVFAEDGQPTDTQIDAAFKKADPDNDGTVSRAEARRFGITKEAFDHANPDKDGSLDKKEFLAAITYQFQRANPDKDSTLDRKEAAKAGIKSKKTFDAANPDKDGTLDLAEYLQALTLKAK